MAQSLDEWLIELQSAARKSGLALNPDEEFTRQLLTGMLVNKERYGYPSCPCRLGSGVKEEDLDIICPCDYRDVDVDQHGMCYCGLYLRDGISGQQVHSIPDRRRAKTTAPAKADSQSWGALSHPVYRCKVCGYLCARESPPGVCPICGATKERFERFA